MPSLVIVNAFCQMNLTRGYRYIDLAGKIMNTYDDYFQEKSVGISGLTMRAKDAIFKELQVSPERIWLRMAKPDTLQWVVDHASKHLRDIADIIEVSNSQRFGLRLEGLYPVEDAESATRSAAHILVGKPLLPDDADLSTFEVSIEMKAKDLDVALRISPVRREAQPQEEDTLPASAIMFDADIHQKGDALPVTDVRKFLMAAKKWVDDSLYPLVDRTMSEVPNG